MRHLSFRPALTLSGRRFRGLRGYAGKPFHPPLTDVPITAYLFAAAFDILSAALRPGHPDVARQLYVAGSWLLVGGAGFAVIAVLTGWADWHRSSEPGTQARRTINAHAFTMLAASTLVAVDLVLRDALYPDAGAASLGVVALSVAAAVLVSVGATLGGSLVYDYGFNVETAGDHPVWHRTEADVLPGQHAHQQDATPGEVAGV
jgi:uncharacterized membrane protein